MTQAEHPDPQAYYQSLPLELQLEPPGTTIVEVAVRLHAEDPRILPALGAIARRAGDDKNSIAKAAVAAFLLGRQYEQSKLLDEHFVIPDAPESAPTEVETPPV